MTTPPRRSKASRADKGKTPASATTTHSPSAKFVAAACMGMVLFFSAFVPPEIYNRVQAGVSFLTPFILVNFGVAVLFLLAAVAILKQQPENQSRTTRKRDVAVVTESVTSAQLLGVSPVAPAQVEEAPVVQVGHKS